MKNMWKIVTNFPPPCVASVTEKLQTDAYFLKVPTSVICIYPKIIILSTRNLLVSNNSQYSTVV